MTLCRFVQRHRHFGGTCCFHLQCSQNYFPVDFSVRCQLQHVPTEFSFIQAV